MQNQTGDFEDVYDFVARMRDRFNCNKFHINAGQLFDELNALELRSPEKIANEIPKINDDNIFDKYRNEIMIFNKNIPEDKKDAQLDPETSDCLLILILEKYAEKIETNHPTGRGKGRPPRIRRVATAYKEIKKNRDEEIPAADEPKPNI